MGTKSGVLKCGDCQQVQQTQIKPPGGHPWAGPSSHNGHILSRPTHPPTWAHPREHNDLILLEEGIKLKCSSTSVITAEIHRNYPKLCRFSLTHPWTDIGVHQVSVSWHSAIFFRQTGTPGLSYSLTAWDYRVNVSPFSRFYRNGL